MGLESITLHFAKNDLVAAGIQAEINNVLEKVTASDSAATRDLPQRIFPHSSEVPSEEPETGMSHPIDKTSLRAIDEQLFGALRRRAKRILIPMTVVRYHLVNKMG
jgi:hypothetical protein